MVKPVGFYNARFMKNDFVFTFYVLNYNFDTRSVEPFNIFENITVNDTVLKEIKKYIKSPKNYSYTAYTHEVFTGFDGLCVAIDKAIAHEEMFRAEYEILVGGLYEKDVANLRKIDCYFQAHANIKTIARDCIAQYKEYKKNISHS